MLKDQLNYSRELTQRAARFKCFFYDNRRLPEKLLSGHHETQILSLQQKGEEEFIQRLSDAFEDHSGGCIELTVRTLNINYGHNNILLKKSPSLYGYSYFVAAVRKNLKKMSLQESTAMAVDECIENDILRDFFLEQKSEVIAMSIYEYNEDYVRKALYEDGEEHGYQKGKETGKAETLIHTIESVMRNFHVDLQKACEGAGISIKEYQEAKKQSEIHTYGSHV